MSNSREKLLADMQGSPVTHGWGAVSIFSRARLNRLLEQQFVASFDEFSFLPSFTTDKVFLDDDETEWMDLRDVILSKPLLSFESASLDNSEATLTLGIMSGNVTVSAQPVGRPATLISSFKLAEQQGYTLTMTINLAMVVGEVDHRGRVTLDLHNGIGFSCNLAEQLNAQNRIGEVFKRFIQALPRHKRVFELGTLDLKGYNPLTPTTFHIRTQAAPGAKVAKASNFGDGGVLIFIELRDKPSPGSFPGEGSGFPYFLPDDRDAQANDLYSAALVISHDMIQHIEQDRLDILNSLLFPGERVFVESSRHTPHDLIVFGNIDPTLTSITLDPLFKVIRAGSAQQFSVVQAGKVLKATDVTWSVRSINTLYSAGSISSTGLYSSVAPAQAGKESVRNVVTATYIDPVSGEARHASALVSIAFEGVSVSPQASVNYMVAPARPVALSAATLGGGKLNWTLLDAQLGTLIYTGDKATYTPPAELPDGGLAVQRIQVQDMDTGEKAQASVLLLAVGQTLTVSPAYVAGMNRSATVQLTVPYQYVQYAHWSVVSGEGTVENGIFTAPEQIDSPVSVVQCEIVVDGIPLLSGYSIIQLSDFVAEKSWNKLAQFTLTALANNRQGYANGFQQIAIDVEIETENVDGIEYPVTEEEMSSLTLVFSRSGQSLDYLPDGLEGIEPDASYRWAVRTAANRFNIFGTGLLSPPAASAYEVRGAKTRRRVYVQTRATNAEILHARFIDSYFGEHNSNEKNDEEPYRIELVPVGVPQFNALQYEFKPARVAGGGEESPLQEHYDYFLNTTDYWKLEFTGENLKPLRFIRLELDARQSTIQWESRRVHETMFSYSGFAFNDDAVEGDELIMHYDERLHALMPGKTLDTNVIVQNKPGEGQLLVALFRVDDVTYVQGAEGSEPRELEKPLDLRMLDRNGNYHHLSIGFAPMDVADSRNKFVLAVL